MADHTKRILVTGITGFTGQYLCNALQKSGHVVQGISRNSDAYLNVDLSELSAIKAAISRFQPTNVVHLAGISFPAHPVTSDFYESNVSVTARLLDALAAAQSIKQVIVVSSAAVYAPRNDGGAISEFSEVAPGSHYALSKALVEEVSAMYARSLPILVLRPFNYIGAGQSSDFFVSKIVRAFVSGAKTLELGNLDLIRDFSDVRDVINAYVRLIESDIVGVTVNICSGEGTELRKIIDIASTITGHTLDIGFNPLFARQNEPRVVIGSEERLVSIIGQRKKHSIFDTLKWIINSEEFIPS